MTVKGKYGLTTISVILLFVFSLCPKGWTKDTIKLGISCARSGPAKGLGERYLMGWLACFKQVNASGGINGRQIEWVVMDDAYNGERAVRNTKRLLSEKVDVLAGYVGTPTTRAVIEWMEKNKIVVPFFFPLTGARIIKKTVFPGMYAMRPFYSDEINLMVDYFVSQGYSRFGIFYQDDTFGLSGKTGFIKALNKYDLLSYYEGKYNKKTLEMRQAVKEAIKDKPEVIILVGTAPPAAKFIKEVLEKSEGYAPIFVCLSFILPEELINLVGKQVRAQIYVSQVVPCPGRADFKVVQEYRKAMEKFYPDSKFSFTSLEGYIGAKLLCEVLRRAEDLSLSSIRQAAESMKNYNVGLDVSFGFSPLNHRSKLFVGLYRWDGSSWHMVAEKRFGFVSPEINTEKKEKSVQVILTSVKEEED